MSIKESASKKRYFFIAIANKISDVDDYISYKNRPSENKKLFEITLKNEHEKNRIGVFRNHQLKCLFLKIYFQASFYRIAESLSEEESDSAEKPMFILEGEYLIYAAST